MTRFFDNGPTQSIQTTDLPTWNEWQLLCDQYFLAVDPLAHLLSRAAFERTAEYVYEGMWQGAPARDSIRALVLAVSFAAVVSLPFLECQRALGAGKTALVERYKSATEAQLRRSKVLKTSNLETIQAAVIYLVGSIIKLYQIVG